MHHLTQLDFNLLKTLYVLLEEQNVSRTAERLHLTQPAVSNMLARLRHYFNDPLFIRSAHGMLPTDKALALKEPLQKILQDINVLVQPADFNPQTLTATVHIGVSDDAMQSVGLPLSWRLNRLAPNLKLAFYSLQGQDAETLLAQGKLDMAVLSELAVGDGLHQHILYHEHYLCAVRENHPVLSRTWDLDAFCALEFVLVSHFGGGFFGATDKALQALGRQRKIVMSLQHFSLIPALLSHSDWAAVVPAHSLRYAEGLSVLEPPFAISGYNSVLVWHPRKDKDPVQQWLRQTISGMAFQTA